MVGLSAGSAIAVEAHHPTLVDEQSVRADIALRESIGFRSDIAYVRSLHTAADVIQDPGVGAAFTPAEAKEFQVRRDLERDSQTLQSYFATHPELHDAFAGILIDHAAGGYLVLQLVQSHPARGGLAAHLPHLHHPDRLRIEQVRWSSTHLHQHKFRISSVAQQYPEIQAVALDEAKNQVLVVINPADLDIPLGTRVAKDRLAPNLATLVADPAVGVWAGPVIRIPSVVRAGQQWNTVNQGVICTLAFEVVDDGKPSMLTAGHCVKNLNPTTTVYNFTTAIGWYSGVYQYGTGAPSGGVDVGVLTMSSGSTATDDILQGGTWPTLDVDGAVESTSYVQGNIRCYRGSQSGRMCGAITIGSVDFLTPEGGWLRDMFTIDPTNVGGDSGAPMYRAGSSTAQAAGVLFGGLDIPGSTNGMDTAGSKWHNAANLFGLTVVTTD
jgi:hypothetical protein